jgi:hypothetical protein
MTETIEPSEPVEPSRIKIQESDLLKYVGGNLDALPLETYQLIANERKRIGSPIYNWLQQFDGKAKAPLNVDLAKLAQMDKKTID